MKPDSLAIRLLGAAAVWSVAALLAGGWLLTSLFRDYVERGFDDRLIVLLEGLVAVSSLDAGGELRLERALPELRFEQPYSGWYWQINGPEGPVLRSRSLWDQVLEAPAAVAGGEIRRYRTQGPERQVLRTVARSISLPGSEARYRFHLAADTTEMEVEIRRFTGILAWSLGLLGFGLLSAIFLQVKYGLRPLGRIGTALADIRSGRADRLEGRFPAEITPLAEELNALLEHNAQVVERARTHVGNLAHALKTPLSVLTNEAATGSGALAETVRRQSALIRRQVDHHLARARTAAAAGILSARTDVRPVIEDLCRTLERMHAARAVSIEVVCPAPITFRGERQDLEEMLGNLIDNGCKWGRTRVRVSVAAEGDRFSLAVEDDGPGLDAEQRAAVLERGRRFDETVPGSGLGLAIVRDIARLYGGEVTLAASSMGGLRVALTLPAVAASGAPA